MQLRRKIKQLLSITLCLMMLVQYIPAPARAAETKTIFLNPGGSSLWDQGGAWFAAWTWGGSSADAWVRFEETEEAGLYRAAMPADRTNMKLVRMSSAGQDFTWDRVSGNNPGIWNETGDLTLSGTNNLYTVTGWEASDGAWSHRHIPGTPATCQRGPVCDLCGAEYGEPTGDHTFDETGKCTVCGAACTHSSFADGKCTVCGADCTHKNFTDGKCDDCGITGGYCGDVIWTYDEVTKAFAITGTGAMEDYSAFRYRPWDGSISENATSVTISEGVTRIGKMAFHSFTQITAVTVPASVESIGYCAFTACEAMESITFAEGSRLTAIDSYVFQSCTALKQITLPAGVTSADSTVFMGCDSLTGIFVEEGSTTLKDIDGVLYTADGTKLLIYPMGKEDTAFTTPAGVTTIGGGSFEGNVNLKTITLSEGVTTIAQAFGQMKSLTTVTIPSSVTRITQMAFRSCYELTTINAPCNWDTDNPLYTFDSTVAVIVGNHTPNADSYTGNEDGTHSFTCSVCRMDAAESHSTEKEENKATCNRGKICDLCGTEYGEPTGEHTFDENSKCTVCGAACTHSSFADGKCTACGADCTHESFTDGKCDDCGITGGYCGDVIWTYDEVTKAFAITGTGAMEDYNSFSDRPWDGSISENATSVTISEGVTRIGERAFQNFKITAVTVPASVESIGYCAFTTCDAMESITFAEGSHLTAFDQFVFQQCTALKQITLPAGVTSVDWSVFSGCRALTDIFVEEGSTTLKDIDGVLYTADGRTLLRYPAGKDDTAFTTPAGVTTIGEHAFQKNVNLETITLSEGVTTIGMLVFWQMESLTTVTIPSSVSSIAYAAFEACDNLTTINAPCNWDTENPLYTFDSTVAVIVGDHTPNADGCTANENGTHSFTCSVCRMVAAESHSTEKEENNATCQRGPVCDLCGTEYGEPTGEHTFDENRKCTVCGADCTHESFTDGKCDDCGITGGYCGDVIWTYDEVTKAFAITGTGAMEDYNSYSDRPWDGSISENATSVTISEGVTRIGETAFQNFKQITAVTVPASVESIGSCAFTTCEAQSITFAEGSRLTAFDSFVFQNCFALKQITLPAGVTSVHWSVFSGCRALTDIFVEAGSTTLKDIDGVLYTADGRTLLLYPSGKDDTAFTTPEGVTTIGECAFEGNVNLKTITLSEGVTRIGKQAFRRMESLTTVTIPSSVTSIGRTAFQYCDNLTTINAPCNWDTENPLYTFDSTVAVTVGDHTPDEAFGQTCMGYRCTVCESWFGVGNGDNHLKIGQCDCGLTAYPIWVMGIQVTNVNKDDVIPTISGMGGGAYGVRYDPEENILYAATKFGDPDADNVALKVIGDITLCAKGATIFGNVDVTGALTVTGEGTVTVNGYRYGIRAASISLGDGVYVLAKGDRAVESAAVTGQGYSRTAADRDYAPFTAPGTEAYFEYVGRKRAQVAVTVDGKTQYYQSLDDAIRAVKNCTASDNAVVTLLTDLDLGGNHQEITSGVFTIDLNGKTVTGEGVETFRINGSGANVTFDNGSIEAVLGCVFVATGTANILNVSMSVTDEGGTAAYVNSGLYAQSPGKLYIDGATITSAGLGVGSFYNGASVEIKNSSIISETEDISKNLATLTVGENVTFPGGLTVNRGKLNQYLAEGYAYWQDGKMLTVADDATSIDGDVTVKAECKHEGCTLSDYKPTDDGEKHTAIRSCCGTEVTGDHSFDEAGKCTLCPYVCDHSGSRHTTATNDGDTHSFTCSVCQTEVTGQAHDYTRNDAHRCICGDVEKYTVSLHANTAGVEIVSVNGNGDAPFTAEHGKPLTAVLKNTASSTLRDADIQVLIGETSVAYTKTVNEEGDIILAVDGAVVTGDLVIEATALVKITVHLGGAAPSNPVLYSVYDDVATVNGKAGSQWSWKGEFVLDKHTLGRVVDSGDAGKEYTGNKIFLFGDVNVTLVWDCNADDLTHVEATPATCSTTGIKEHWSCACGKNYADENAVTELGSVVDPVNSEAHAYPEIPNSCTNDGDTHTEHYICILDGSHTKEVSGVEHTYKDGACVCGYICDHAHAAYPAEGITDTQHKLVCACGYEMYEAHSTGKAGDKAATCKDKAYCSVCQSEYGKTVDHSIDSATGRCRFGCGEELAVISVALRDTVAYFETATEAFAYATDYGDWRTVTLLADVTEDIFPMITGYVELDTNGYTLTVSQISVGSGNSGAWLNIDDSADVPGTLVLQSASGGIHINQGTVQLLTGNVRATGGTGVIVNSGLFHMYDGSTLEARHHGILINDSQGSLQVEGGTVQAGADTDGQAYFAVYHRAGVGSSVLSGGIFLGGICRREEGSATERSLRDMLADHYAFYAYDPQSGMGEMLAQPELKYCLDEDLAVGCAHDLDHVNNRKATCTERAYCGKCMQFYGGTDPDNHDLTLNTDGTDTVTQTCRNGCDYSRSIRLTVPQGAVYDGAEKAAAWEGDTLLGHTPEITYFLSGEEIHGTPTEPGSYTAKLTVGDVYVTADFAIDRITVTPYVDDTTHFERQYDGTIQAPGNALPVSYRGNINTNHSVAFRCSFAFTSPNADTREMVASFSITGNDAKYYKLSEETLSGDWGRITPKPLRVDFGEYTVVYGEEAPEFQPTYTGFVTGEDHSVLPEEVIILCEYDPTDPAKRNVGTYPIRPDNNLNGNYTLTAGQGQLTVVPAQVTVKIHDQTVTYGERAPEFTFDCQGLRYDDLLEDLSPEFTLQCDYDPNIADAVAGSSYPITLASGGESNDNYTVTSLPGRLTVEKRPVTVTLSGSLSKDYDGTDSTGAASGELMPVAEGILSRDTVSAVIGSSRFASPDASQAPVTVIAEDIRLEGEDAANYFLTATTAQTHTGAIRPLDISGLDITPAPQLYWTGAEQTQQILVPNIGSLEPTYEVTGNRATHVGLYTLTVTGTGNFTGSREAEYAMDVDVSKLDFGGKNPSAQHLDTVNAILEALDSRDPDGDHGSYGEIWDTLEDNCVFLKTGIEDAQRALNSQAIRDTEACTDQNVQKEDRDSLEQALADLTDVLENHGGFLSEEEAAAAGESINRVKGALAALERVENAEAAAQALPDIITSAAADKAVEAADAWDSLSDHEKSLLKPETAEKLETAGKVTQDLNANVIRIYGDTRIETSLAAALELKALKDGKAFTDIVIARGDDFADALSAGYLAGQKDAPILLVTEGTMDTVKNFIRENAAPGANLYILGGTAAISDSILTGLSGYSLKRLAGANRYETNLLVLAEAGTAGKCMVLCSGTGYADALSAAALGCPIMLVGKKLLPQQEEFLADSSRNVFIIGGEKAVNGTVEQAVAALGCQVERIGGANRYETSLLVAQKAAPKAQSVVLVSGRKYPDALCAGPLAQRLAAPILLVDEGAEQYAGSFIRAGSIRTAYVLGGYQALPSNCSEGLLEW